MKGKAFKVSALSAGVAIALGTAPPSLAQESEVEEIIVTGSHIRRTEYDGRAPIQIVDQEAIELIGAAQPVEMLNELTANSGSEFYNETNNRAGSSQVNIRKRPNAHDLLGTFYTTTFWCLGGVVCLHDLQLLVRRLHGGKEQHLLNVVLVGLSQ